jgi:hypothetical protein
MKLRTIVNGFNLTCAALVLAALLALVPGCSKFGKKDATMYEKQNEWIQDMEERIADHIKDPATRTEMMVIVDQVGQDLVELVIITRKLYADFIKLDDSYTATPEDYQKLISEFEADHKIVSERVIESRFKLKDLTTPQEWDALTDSGDNEGVFRMTIMPSQDMEGGTS